MSARSFEVALNRFVKETVPEKHSQLVRAVSLQVLNGVVLKSPVDTGRMRGNWIVSVNAESRATSANTDKSGQETINSGLAVIGGAPAFARIVVQNNLPYAGRLEDGHSRQAPQGMVRLTVAEVEAQFA